MGGWGTVPGPSRGSDCSSHHCLLIKQSPPRIETAIHAWGSVQAYKHARVSCTPVSTHQRGAVALGVLPQRLLQVQLLLCLKRWLELAAGRGVGRFDSARRAGPERRQAGGAAELLQVQLISSTCGATSSSQQGVRGGGKEGGLRACLQASAST